MIGLAVLAGDIITVMVLEDDRIEYGVNGWVANEKDRRLYNGAGGGGTDEQED